MIHSADRRLAENNMLYRVGDKVLIQDYDESISSGLTANQADLLKPILGKVVEIKELHEAIECYDIVGHSLCIYDGDVKHVMLT